MAKPLNPHALPFFSRTNVIYAQFQSSIPYLGQSLFVFPRRLPVYIYYPIQPLPLVPSSDPIPCPSPRRFRKSVWIRRDHLVPAPETTTADLTASDERTQNSIIPFPEVFSDLERSNSTTVMLKNIPNRLRRGDVLEILDDHCQSSGSEYNFLYLPMDFNKYWNSKKIANLGYAFVNFTSSEHAWRFFETFHNYSWSSYHSEKVCQVTLAKIQGLESLKASFETKNFYCEIEDFLPVMFQPARDGTASSCQGFNIGIMVETRPRHPIWPTQEPVQRG